MATLTSILGAIIALPKIGAYIEEAIQGICAWYLARQTGETLSQIADAAAAAGRATDAESRFKAAELWQKALSRSRTTP